MKKIQRKYFDFATNKISQAEAYRLMIGGIVPRPIALVSTIAKNGVGNLAPFSFFNGVSSKPACLVLSLSNKDTKERKDTLRNIIETGEFVVNSVEQSFVSQAVATAASYPYGVNELEITNLTALPSILVKPPRVQESSFQMECKLQQIVQIGSKPEGSELIIGEILLFHVAEEIYKADKISYEEYEPVARLGGINYAKLSDFYQLAIPKVAGE